MSRVGAALLLLLLAGAGACSSGSSPPTRPRPLIAAPEPAHAPVPAVRPAGTVLALGGHPEGVVADPVSGLVVVALRGPDRLVLVDPAARRVVRTVAVPASARHLELVPEGGAVLVPGEDTDLVTRVELPSGRVTGSVGVGKQPHDVAVVGDGSQYVADEFGGAVSLVRGGAVVQTFSGLLQPGGAAGTGDTATVVDVRARLLHIYRRDREVAALPAGEGPTHAVALQPGSVLVTDTTGGALLRYDVRGAPRLVSSTPLPGQPYGTAYDAQRGLAFVTATGRNLLAAYRLSGQGLSQVRTWPTVRNAYSVAVVPKTGRLVVLSESESQLQFIDP